MIALHSKAPLHLRKHRSSCSRAAYTYIAVVTTAVIVSTLAMSSVWIVRKNQLEQTAADEVYSLANAADSAVELALARIANDSNWRINHAHNTEYGPFTLGQAKLFYRLLDPQGDIAGGRLRDISVVGIATQGTASYAVQVETTPAGPALTSLGDGIAVDGPATLSWRTAWVTNNTIYLRQNVGLEWEASLTGEIQTSGSITNNGGFLKGPVNVGVNPVHTFPNATTLQRYVTQATIIDINQLSLLNGSRQFSNCLLSPYHNPFGTETNGQGIYRIDCLGENIELTNCRILGTLILENLGIESKLKSNVYAAPALPNYPSLFIAGNIKIDSRWGNFSEATLGINLNPSGAPYRGDTNETLTDIYPSRIDGIYCCLGQTYFVWDSKMDIDGLFISSSINLQESASSLRVTYDSEIAANPPPGFRDDYIMRPIRGTYRRVATP